MLQSSAGTVEFLDDEDFETIEVGEEVPAEADFGLALNGDSMEPRYHDKQAIWVQQTNALNNGEIGIFYLDGKTYCKQLKNDADGVFLVSLNSKYEPIPVTEDSIFKIFGRALNKHRKRPLLFQWTKSDLCKFFLYEVLVQWTKWWLKLLVKLTKISVIQ